MDTPEIMIAQTKKWINDIVVGCNFCPFVAQEIRLNTIHYQVEVSSDLELCLHSFVQECLRLDEDKHIETTLLIFPNAFKRFDEYLDVLAIAEKFLTDQGYEGVYQLASFHPLYCFANADINDAANYTNRSVYPMFHLLREERIEEALKRYPDPENIPENNINFARQKGLAYMKMLRDACFTE
jgi:hypothetical protein